MATIGGRRTFGRVPKCWSKSAEAVGWPTANKVLLSRFHYWRVAIEKKRTARTRR